MGPQPLYDLRVSLFGPAGSRSDSNDPISTKTIRVGFRTVQLLQPRLRELLGEAASEGGAGSAFHFRVNGANVFAKGANLAPLHILPERSTKRMVDDLLNFAKSSHMNLLRVWGQGMYESDYLYAKADQLGIMVWQDFAFGNR